MHASVRFSVLVGIVIASAPSAWGQAGACGHPVSGGHHAGCSVPCAGTLKASTDPLPCITLSRYVDQQGDYDCVKRVHGDGYPHFPRYWFRGQTYPLSHDYAAGGRHKQGSSEHSGPSGGRGVGVGGYSNSEGSRGGGQGVGTGRSQ